MRPILFRLGDVSVPSYEVMLLVAAAVTAVLALSEAERRGLDLGFAPYAAAAGILGALLGGKLHWALAQPGGLGPDPAAALLEGGVTFYGGLVGGLLAIIAVLLVRGVPLPPAGDAAAPALAIGYALARLGCLLVGDDYGRPTSLPWGIAFPNGRPPALEPVHPTQAYEILLMVPVFLFLWSRRKRARPPGTLFAAFLALIAVERFAIEFLRTNARVGLGQTATQWLSIAVLATAAAGWVWVRRIGARERPALRRRHAE